MKTYKIIVIYPGMYQKDYILTGNLLMNGGVYHIIDSDGYSHYFPINLTILETIKPDKSVEN